MLTKTSPQNITSQHCKSFPFIPSRAHRKMPTKHLKKSNSASGFGIKMENKIFKFDAHVDVKTSIFAISRRCYAECRTNILL